MDGTGLVAVQRPLPRSGGRLLVAVVLAVVLGAVIGASARPAPAVAAVSTAGVLGWGANGGGQLGDGTNTGPEMCSGSPCSTTPLFADLPEGVTPTAVSTAAFGYSVALDATGQVWGWGENYCGQFGNGTTDDSLTPVKGAMPAGVTLTAITAAYYHVLALTSTGQVLAWGCNNSGQLGIGTSNGPETCRYGLPCSTKPVYVDLPQGVKVTAIANYGGNGTSLALTSTGQVLAWGGNDRGQLGIGTATGPETCQFGIPCSTKPVYVNLPSGVTATEISGRQFYSMARTSTGRVLTWGLNDRGQLGIGTDTGPQTCAYSTPCSTTPVYVNLPTGVTATKIMAGRQFGLALTSSGELLAWGDNDSGQFGNGTTTSSFTPVPVDLPVGVSVTALAAAATHALALTSTGQVLAWGGNQDGQLGIGTSTGPEMCTEFGSSISCSTTPVYVHVPAGVAVAAIYADAYQSIALARGAPTLMLSKALSGPRVNARDQFTVQIKDSTGEVLTDSTTAGSGSTITEGTGTTEFTATPGTEYFLTEAGADLGDYTHTITCTDESGLQPESDLPHDAPLNGSFAITPVAGAAISCTITNTAAPGPSPSPEVSPSPSQPSTPGPGTLPSQPGLPNTGARL